MSLIAPELDHRKLEKTQGTYRFSRLVSNTGQTSFSLQAASKQEIVWDLPVRPRNLSHTYFNFNLEVTAPGASGSFNKVWTKGMALCNQIELRNRSGTQIVYVDNADQVYNALAPYCNRLDDTLEHGTVLASATPATSVSSQTSMIHRSNALADATPASNTANASRMVSSGAAVNVSTQADADVNYTEEQYFQVGGDNAKVCIHFAIPLSEFFGTFLAEKPDCFFEEVVQLRINLNEFGKVGWSSNSATALGTVAALAGATITNCYLMDALQVDRVAAKDIIRLVRAGKTQRMPYMVSYKESIPASATQYNRQLKMNEASVGDRVLRICHFTTNGPETGATNMDTSNTNVAGVANKKTSFFTSLDSLRLQEVNIQCGAAGEDYDFMRPYLKNSVIQSRNHFNHSALWVDDFCGNPLADCRINDSVKNGLEMQNLERTWQLEQQLPTNAGTGADAVRNHYVVVVGQRTLTQQNGQILVA